MQKLEASKQLEKFPSYVYTYTYIHIYKWALNPKPKHGLTLGPSAASPPERAHAAAYEGCGDGVTNCLLQGGVSQGGAPDSPHAECAEAKNDEGGFGAR